MRTSRSLEGKKWLRALGLLQGVAAVTVVALLPAPAPSRAAEDDLLSLRPVADRPLASIALRYPHHAYPSPGSKGAPTSASALCDKDIDSTGNLAGVAFVASQDNGICTTGEADAYENGGSLHVAQAGGQEAAFTITRIAANGTPTLITQMTWAQPNTYTADIKAFKQGTSRYIALALERLTVSGACGVVIVDVTNAPTTPIVKQVTGAGWCDVHNVFVEDDASGNGKYLYLTADFPNDMRVLDIGDLSNATEIGRYTHPEASSSNYVHDMTVVDHGGTIGRRVYVSYWDAGLMILDAADVTPGVIETGSPNQPLNPAHSIDPPGFLTHDAYPSADGSRVFIEDEFLNTVSAEPVQMWDISSPASPVYVDGIALGSALMPVVNPAHNLLVQGDRLYVGWYKAGLQAFDFDSAGFIGRPIYHQVQTEAGDGAYDGAWNVLLATIGTTTYIFQSDRRFGLIVDAALDLPDGDGDGIQDSADNCPSTANGPAQAAIPGVGDQTNTDADLELDLWRLGTATPPPILAGDSLGDACDDDDDNDFFSDAEEQRLYGSPGFAAQQLVPCPSPGNPDPWPADVAPFSAPDRVIDTTDAVVMLGFVGLGPSAVGYPSVRYDLDNDGPGALDTTEVVVILGFVGYSCQTPLT